VGGDGSPPIMVVRRRAGNRREGHRPSRRPGEGRGPSCHAHLAGV